MSVLVEWKCDAFNDEFQGLVSTTWWAHLVPQLDHPDQKPLLIETITTLSLVAHAEFSRRILRVCKSFPILLLNLGLEVRPDRRQECARKLLAETKPDPTTQKFLAIHSDAVVGIANDAAAYPKYLCSCIAAFKAALVADTQEVESANKVALVHFYDTITTKLLVTYNGPSFRGGALQAVLLLI